MKSIWKALIMLAVIVLAVSIMDMFATMKVVKNEAQIADLKAEIVEVKQLTEKVEKDVKTKEKRHNTYTCDVTAYCSCELCCGEWALNRLKDENGNDIVIGASGRELIPGYSVAVDPEVIPLGSKLYISGKEYRADDVGGMIQGNRIDVYFSSHEEALQFPMGSYKVEVEK